MPLEHIQNRNCDALRYSYFLGTEEHVDSMQNTPESIAAFYENLEKFKPTTSQLSAEIYKEFFLQNLQHGDLLHIAFGSGMSNSVNNAFLAAKEINTKSKNKVTVIDSTCSCVGYGLLVDIALDMRDEGKSLKEIANWTENNKRKIHHQFFTTTLSYFKRSGRVSLAAAFLGNLLRLCPLMRLNNDGKIVAYSKVMSVSKAVDKTIEEVGNHIQNGKDYNGKLWIAHSNCPDAEQKVHTKLASLYPHADIRTFDIGPIIACHCGPGTVAVFFEGDERVQ